MKDQYRKVDLSRIAMKLHTIPPSRDYKIRFCGLHALMTVLNLVNINIALHSDEVSNYNLALFGFNMFFLTRKLLSKWNLYLWLQNPTKNALSIRSAGIISSLYSICIIHGIVNTFTAQQLYPTLYLFIPFLISIYMSRNNKERYSTVFDDVDCGLKTVIYITIEQAYFAGFLPYKYLPSSGYYVNYYIYLNSLVTLCASNTLLYMSELLRTRAIELQLHAKRLSQWQKLMQQHSSPDNWRPNLRYRRGTVVSYESGYWRATTVEAENIAGQDEDYYILKLFSNPSLTYRSLLIVGVLFLMLQLGCLLLSQFCMCYVLQVFMLSCVLIRIIQIEPQIILAARLSRYK